MNEISYIKSSVAVKLGVRYNLQIGKKLIAFSVTILKLKNGKSIYNVCN
jgi:hypothetical protein